MQVSGWGERVHMLFLYVMALLNKNVLEESWIKAIHLMYQINRAVMQYRPTGTKLPVCAYVRTRMLVCFFVCVCLCVCVCMCVFACVHIVYLALSAAVYFPSK